MAWTRKDNIRTMASGDAVLIPCCTAFGGMCVYCHNYAVDGEHQKVNKPYSRL